MHPVSGTRDEVTHAPSPKAGPVTDVQVREIFEELHPNSFLRMYLRHAGGITDAPGAFHLMAGLGTIASIAPWSLSFTYGQEVPGNLFTVLFGASGNSRKSTALALSRKLLKDSMFVHVPSTDYGSYQAMKDDLIENPMSTLIYSEMGYLFATARTGSYLGPMKMLLNQLYDTEDIGRQLVKNRTNGTENNVTKYGTRISFLGGINPAYAEALLEDHDWSGGLVGRWLTMCGERTRTLSIPGCDPAMTLKLVARLQSMQVLFKDPTDENGTPTSPNRMVCGGFSPEARPVWEKWFADLDFWVRARVGSGLVSDGVSARLPANVLKMAMLLTLNRQEAEGGLIPRKSYMGWAIAKQDLILAQRIGDMVFQSALHLDGMVASTPYLQKRRKIMEIIGRSDHGMAPLDKILRGCQLSHKECMDILDTQVKAGVLDTLSETVGTKTRTVYFLVPDDDDGLIPTRRNGFNAEGAAAAGATLLPGGPGYQPGPWG